jgi:hypothetical protein
MIVFQRFQKLAAWPLVIAAGMLLAGCGGAGGTGGGVANQVVFPVDGSVEQRRTLDDATLVLPAGSFATGSTITLSRETVGAQPPNQAYEVLSIYTVQSSADASGNFWIEINHPAVEPIVAVRPDGQMLEMERLSATTTRVVFRPQDRINGIWRVFLGRLTDPAAPDYTFDLVRIAGAGPLGPGSLIVVPGFNDAHDAIGQFAQGAMVKGYTNVYAYRYDWRQETSRGGQDLANRLRQIQSAKGIDIVGASRGGLIVRYALEVEGATKPIRNAILIGVPNLGVSFTDSNQLVNALQADYLSRNGSRFQPRTTDPVIPELAPNSTLLQLLNREYGQRGHVNYYLVAPEDDNFVTADSALLQPEPVGEYVAGIVERITLPGSQANIMRTAQGATALWAALNLQRPQPQLQIHFPINPVQADPTTADPTWSARVIIRNNHAQPVLVEDLAIDGYNRYGQWGNTHWYDPATPPRVFLPTTYHFWGHTIPAGEERVIWVYWPATNDRQTLVTQAPPDMQAATAVFTARYRVQGERTSTTAVLYRSFGDIHAAPPQTRAPKGQGPGAEVAGPR